jgi:hypothetical protein
MTEPEPRETEPHDSRPQIGRRTFVPAAEAIAAFTGVPSVDPDELRADLDEFVDQDLFSREW